jgi:hypothetical protein
MPPSKTNSSNAMGWTAGIIAVVLLAGVTFWLVSRKAPLPPAPKTAAPTVAPETAPAADDSVILKEDFATLDAGKWPKDWQGWENGKNRKMKIKEDGRRHFLEFTASNAFKMRLSRVVPCSQNYSAYDFSIRARVEDMTPRRGQIRGATLGVDWLDAKGRDISESDLDYLTEPGDWRLLEGVYQAPPNATKMRVFPLLTRCGGTVDFEDITVKGVEMESENVVYKENFENAATPAQVKSWSWDAPTPDETLSIKSESGAYYLEFQGTNDTDSRHFGSVDIPLDPSWSRIRFTAKVRGRNLTTDSTQSVAGLCVLGYWIGESGNTVTPYRVQTDAVRNNGEWKRLDVVRQIPPGAKTLSLNLIFLFASGSVDITDIKVTVVQ